MGYPWGDADVNSTHMDRSTHPSIPQVCIPHVSPFLPYPIMGGHDTTIGIHSVSWGEDIIIHLVFCQVSNLPYIIIIILMEIQGGGVPGPPTCGMGTPIWVSILGESPPRGGDPLGPDSGEEGSPGQLPPGPLPVQGLKGVKSCQNLPANQPHRQPQWR